MMPIMLRNEIQNSLLFLHFLNKDTSFNIPYFLRFDQHVYDDHSEASMSQIFYLGPSFQLMHIEKRFLKMTKSYPFFIVEIKTKA